MSQHVNENPTWISGALCAQTALDVFFPEQGETAEQAKRICSACPYTDPCLQYALDHDEQFGVWGGLDQGELRRLRRAARKRAA